VPGPGMIEPIAAPDAAPVAAPVSVLPPTENFGILFFEFTFFFIFANIMHKY
jgi:hypothetical protein